MVAHTEAHGLVDTGTAKGLKAYEDIYHAVHFREDCIFKVWIAITVSAPDQRTLNQLEPKLMQTVSAMSLAVTPLYKEQLEGLAFSHVLGQRQDRLLKAWPGRLTHAEAFCP